MASTDSSTSSLSDIESQKTMLNEKISHWRLVRDPTLVTDRVLNYHYRGSGTDNDPYLVEFIPQDPRNPMHFPQWKKWLMTVDMAIATLAVSFVSSAYTGGIGQLLEQFKVSDEVITLGVSLFVLGFAIGPLLWAPLSELYGRQVLFVGTYALLTAFNAGAAGAQNIQTLLILRFFAGSFGSSPLTNAGGVISDMFNAEQRGLATSLFAVAPFMGPVLGPIVGGFVGQSIGWRWVEGIMAIFTGKFFLFLLARIGYCANCVKGALWIIGTLTVPETYAPFILRKRAEVLSKKTGNVYISMLDAKRGKVAPSQAFKTAMSRPWILLFREPIVLFLSIYMAIIYGTLYLMFGAFPIVFQQGRGWSEGIGGLAFLGVAVGMIIGVIFTFLDNKRYTRVAKKSPGGHAPPEARLPPAMVASIVLPAGLFMFAWTCSPTSIHWIVPIIAGAPFGFGMVLVFLSIMNYLVDAYVVYAASVLAANSVLRSLFGAIFPLFTKYMYQNLGPNWASSVPAFLALACIPFPFLFYKYGAPIRKRCKFAAEAAEILERMRQAEEESSSESEEQSREKKGESEEEV
jgi:multidrug resistance protein